MMKKLLVFLLISCCSSSFSNAQDHVQQLITEIKSSNTIQCYFLGSRGMPSELFMKADTLRTLLTENETRQLFTDSSYTLKYYCFYNLLSDTGDDAIVFDLLKQAINDTTKVPYYCGCSMETYAFNTLLTETYYRFMRAKYTYGSPTVLGNSRRVYMFQKADKKTYKEKVRQLKMLIKQSAYRDTLIPYLH